MRTYASFFPSPPRGRGAAPRAGVRDLRCRCCRVRCAYHVTQSLGHTLHQTGPQGVGVCLANGSVGDGLVERLLTGGDIHIESMPGHGTTVEVWLPLAEETDVKQRAQLASDAFSELDRGDDLVPSHDSASQT